MINSDEKKEALIREEKVELVTKTKNNRRRYLWYIPAGFLVIVGSLLMVKDLYDVTISYLGYLSTYQISFWDLQFEDRLNFFVFIFRYISLGLAQIVVGLLLYVYLKNKNESVKASAQELLLTGKKVDSLLDDSDAIFGKVTSMQMKENWKWKLKNAQN